MNRLMITWFLYEDDYGYRWWTTWPPALQPGDFRLVASCDRYERPTDTTGR